MILNYNGKSYEISNWNEFVESVLWKIGFQIQTEIIKQIDNFRAVDTGELRNSIQVEVKNNELIVFSTAPQAIFLEYGTAGARRGVIDPYGEQSRGANPDRKLPVKKQGDEFVLVDGLKDWANKKGFGENNFALAKHIRDYGMSPRPIFRNVFYNEAKMGQIITNALKK